MAYKELKIVSKPGRTPLEIVAVTSRISAPTIIQPSYTFDLSMMYGVFIPEVSFGYGLVWDGAMLDVCINNISLATYAYIDGSLVTRDAYLAKINSSIGWLDASVQALFSGAGASNASLNQIYPLVFKINSSIYAITENIDDIESDLINAASVANTAYVISTANNSAINTINGNITTINNNISGLTTYVNNINTSVGNISNLTFANNTSIGWLDSSIKYVFNVNAAQDTSIAFLNSVRYLKNLLDVSIEAIIENENLIQYDSSLDLWRTSPVTDITDFFYTETECDARFINILSVSEFATNASVNNAFSTNVYINTAYGLSTALNSSIGEYTTNSSINTYFNDSKFIKEASLNEDFVWIDGELDVSILSITTLGSLTDVSIKDVSANQFIEYDGSFGKWMNVDSVEIEDFFYSRAQIDASFLQKGTFTGKAYFTGPTANVSTLEIVNGLITNVY